MLKKDMKKVFNYANFYNICIFPFSSKMNRFGFILSIFVLTSLSVSAQEVRQAENLQRNVVVIPQSVSGSNNLVTWRMLDTDDDYTTFDVIRNGRTVKKHINNSTNYLDTSGRLTTKYQIVTRHHGIPVDTTDVVMPWKDVFMPIRLNRPEGGSFHDVEYTYSPNDCSVADVDGDGAYEIVVKWEPSAEADNSQGGFTGPTVFDCYRLNVEGNDIAAELLWRIDMGHNIRSGAHYVPFLFYDFDGDGHAEFIVKTAPGTIDGTGRYVSQAATDETILSRDDNEKEYLNAGGQVMYGPEYLTVFDGQTGHAIHTIYYNPNRGCFVGGAPEGRSDIWGDDYGNRSERYLAAVAHLNGLDAPASAVMCRGYYTRAYLWAVDFDGEHLTTRWRHGSISRRTVMKTDGHNEKDVREYDHATYEGAEIFTAYGQGNHNLTVGDVDGDGCDEIIYGSAAVDHDGTLLWTTGLSHGDAIHMGDLMPDRPGLEVFQIHEDPPYGIHVCDAATGELLIHHTGEGDCARGMAADVMSSRGYEYWNFGDSNMYNAPTDSVVGGSMSFNFRVYWDGDVYDELLGDIGNHNQPFLEKFGTGRLTIDGKQLYQYGYNVSCNGTKGSPCLVADILGDWREEMIFFNNEDKQTLNLFSTSVQSNTRVPCLMYDHNYRMAIAWQNAGYNQPPHLGYYLPDAVIPRLDFTDLSGANEQEVNLGDSIVPITYHYVNCQGCNVIKYITPDGTTATRLSKDFTLEKDLANCTNTLTGIPQEAGTYQIWLRPTSPSVSIQQDLVITIHVNEAVGIETCTNNQVQSTNYGATIYDLAGRPVSTLDSRHLPLSKGIYLQRGKKIIVR